MLTVAIYIQDAYSLEFNRIDLFSDEKISVTSSIQNINDISKTFTDYSQTFTIPASKQNNKIFRHWYDNSNDIPFSTLVKSNAYIEIDTVLFRKGKIQLETANLIDGKPQDYSITFIGLLGNLKDKFAGLFLKDLTSTAYDFNYSATIVKDRVTQNVPAQDVMFPLISSLNYWQFGTGAYDITKNHQPIRYNDLFPAIRLGAVFSMIQDEFDVSFSGYYQTDDRFYNSYLWLKNSDTFILKPPPQLITWDSHTTTDVWDINLTNESWRNKEAITCIYQVAYLSISFNVAGLTYNLHTYKNGIEVVTQTFTTTTTTQLRQLTEFANNGYNPTDVYTVKISSVEPITLNGQLALITAYDDPYDPLNPIIDDVYVSKSSQSVGGSALSVKDYFPEIKIIDFFTGVLKMFNLTCYTEDGINYTVMPLDEYYLSGTDVDLTQYVIQDKKNLNRVKTFSKINFDYENSDSIINVGFKSNAGIEYGSLHYSTNNDGGEYNIKLPFENLNFQNLSGLLQVGYALKTDFQKYIPKPVILYAYSQGGTLSCPTYHFSTATTGNGLPYETYHAFGQETLIGGQTYSLNFNEQQSTLTNELVTNGLYQIYYSQYFENIFSFKARLIKINTILPTSIITSLKLNDSVIIRDEKYIINTMTTDLTTGEVEFELLTDTRQ